MLLLRALAPLANADLAAASANTGDTNCPCLAATPANTGRTFTLPGAPSPIAYSPSYGLANCSAHDSGLAPFCNRANPPAWCADSWCYVDPSNCAGTVLVDSAWFPGLAYSHFTCNQNANTFLSWFQNGAGQNASGEAHDLDDLVGLVTNYLKSLSNRLEDSAGESTGLSAGCAPASACPASGAATSLVDATNHAPALGLDWNVVLAAAGACSADPPPPPPPPANAHAATTSCVPRMSLATSSYHVLDAARSAAADATNYADQCLAQLPSVFFGRVASKESDLNRIGYARYVSHALGSTVQWPGMEQTCDAAATDPRLGPLYVATATGPKDVVLVLDTSGSMSGAREQAARTAAKRVVRTLTDADSVALVKFSSSAEAYSPSLVRASAANKFDIERWIEQNVDAAGTTNLVAAFDKAWEVVDASANASNCNRVVLLLSDGAPNDNWDNSSHAAVRAKAASYDPPVRLLTFGLDADAPAEVLRRLACDTGGVFRAVTAANLAEVMGFYYEILVPAMEPCKTRWTTHNDPISGKELLTACQAPFQPAAGDATSCNGGLSGLGAAGDCALPELLGVLCLDMNIVVDLDVLMNHPGYADFASAVDADRTACPRLTPTADQLQALRAKLGGAASVCTDEPLACAAHVLPPPPAAPPSSTNAPSELETALILVGSILGLLWVCGFAVCVAVAFVRPKPVTSAAPVYYAPQYAYSQQQ